MKNEALLNQFKMDMDSTFSDDDFFTFISQDDAQKHAVHMDDKYFKSLLTMRSIYEYKLHESRQALTEGYNAGASIDDFCQRDYPVEHQFNLMNQNIMNNSAAMLKIYDQEIEKYVHDPSHE
ncbi:hypothetical protein EMIT07CA2_550130 [Brevibacillus sp. IT-7CA2]|uniref:hypothetical protein n=1 Tax=Brevibacillus sp. IT-7CA2 TaxID=3026436 RepID=UPI0039E0F490